MALVSMFGAACNSQTTTTTQTEPPASCMAPESDGGLVPGLLSPAQGTVTGSEVVARLCEGGASAYLQRTTPTTVPPDQLLVWISESSVDPARDFQIALPVGATRLSLSATIGLAGAQPGTFTESSACGGVTLCAVFPPTTSVSCGPLTSDVCPPGCTISGNNCVPIEPATCYEAGNATACWGGTGSGPGAWRLTVSSVDPYTVPDGGNPDQEFFVIHGRLDATLVKEVNSTPGAVDANAPPPITTSLSLTF